MKKIISISLVLMLLLGILAVPAMAEENVGVLSYLGLSAEEDETLRVSIRQPLIKLLYLHGVLINDGNAGSGSAPTLNYYDSLNALLMALQSGQLNEIKVPYYTAKYLCSTNDDLKIFEEYHPEKATGAAEYALSMLSDGYSFMLKDDNTELRDEFNAQIAAVKEDGTLQKLVDEHILKVAENGEPVAVSFKKFEGDPIRIGVTGDLPPMDYVAPDGSFAGFNTAVLAEIGKRLQKNIELVQVDSVGRALALSEGVVDVVFWTRTVPESLMENLATHEKLEDSIARVQDTITDEEKAILDKMESPDHETVDKLDARDMPAGTIVTQPYFSDFPVLVTLK